MKLLNFLSRWPVILATLVLMNITGYSFQFALQAIGGDLLDMIMTADGAQARLAEMSADQKSAHFKTTAVLDTLYPIFYGGFFVGMTARLSGSKKKWLLLPAVCTVIFDLTENAIHLLSLSGHTELLILKNIVTPVKFASLALTAGVILVLIILKIYQRIASQK